MGLETNRILILIGVSAIISSISHFVSEGSLKPGIMDIALGYYLINFFAFPKPKEFKNDTKPKLIPLERFGLIIASVLLVGLSVLPWFMFANFKITTVITRVILAALKIGSYCGAGVAYRKYILKTAASTELDKREETK